ncbi:uncharacterized protein EI90DRAFT_2471024 [Cantharellus anzutake]|uniref:uncharacterized protein n=1 Tax=Cantharellus anzutake TaxID=1750568 RepID=UPI0019034FCE|nr:uncharacterized protein EI90DRAFT_2471024 [Cantharellus anzutake]KAF8339209.1 hypothetical protein EI90DRAFT_2471024 [Cantharellus anzutake]
MMLLFCVSFRWTDNLRPFEPTRQPEKKRHPIFFMYIILHISSLQVREVVRRRRDVPRSFRLRSVALPPTSSNNLFLVSLRAVSAVILVYRIRSPYSSFFQKASTWDLFCLLFVGALPHHDSHKLFFNTFWKPTRLFFLPPLPVEFFTCHFRIRLVRTVSYHLSSHFLRSTFHFFFLGGMGSLVNVFFLACGSPGLPIHSS